MIFGKSDLCCSSNENDEKAEEAHAPEPANYRSYKEQVLAVSRPRLQEAAMHAARQSDEAIFEVVEAADVEEPGSGSICHVSVLVKESSTYVRIACGVAAVALVLLSSLGTLLSMADRDLTIEVVLSQWVWLVFAWIYAAVICLSELKPQYPTCSGTYQAGIYKVAPAMASQVGRSCFHFAVGLQSLLFRPLYLSIPCCLVLCSTGFLLLLDTRFRWTASSPEPTGAERAGGSGQTAQSKLPRFVTKFIPRMAISSNNS